MVLIWCSKYFGKCKLSFDMHSGVQDIG